MASSYPNFAGKHAEEAMFTPADFVAYLRRTGALADYEAPAGVILCYQRPLYEQVLRAEGIAAGLRRKTAHGLVLLPSCDGQVGLMGRFGIGAPGAVAVLEDLAALGTRRFVSIGTAGSLQRDLAVGSLVVCETAVRDEGVSHHYLPPARLAAADPGLTARLRAALDQAGRGCRTGTSWTIDTPYRETVAEARHYQDEGVLCVEMEAAALFAVGRVRGVQVASAVVISDSLAELVWDPQFEGPQVHAGLLALYDAAVAALRGDAGRNGDGARDAVE